VSFGEGGRCRTFLGEARRQGFEAIRLRHDTPHLRAAVNEVAELLGKLGADVLCCHGYKANLLGRLAARRSSLPVVGVARGWTGEDLKVRFYELLDRLHLRWMDRVVCVSQAQAAKVRRGGVRPARITVIANAVDPRRFGTVDPAYRARLLRLFRRPPARIVGAAGRLSPEKGFDVLITAAAHVVKANPSVGFVVFGDGARRPALLRQIHAAGLGGHFVLAGFRADLDRFLPVFDLFTLPSHTEGMPNVVLEAFAAGVPVVATSAGGTPELIDDGVTGLLTPPGEAGALAGRLLEALMAEDGLRTMREAARRHVHDRFTFAAQASRYRELFAELVPEPRTARHAEEETTVARSSNPAGPADAKLEEDLIGSECGPMP
jgi:glycosyltransferase involved in cell wall biosynthesis